MKVKREKKFLTEDQLLEAVESLKAMSHPVRLRFLQLLANGRYTVKELAELSGVLASAASMQLRMMERCGLLVGHRQGKQVYYEIAEPHLTGMIACLESRYGD